MFSPLLNEKPAIRWISERLYLNPFPFKARLGRSNLLVLQVTCTYFGYTHEVIVSRPSDDMYTGLGASNPLSGLIESKCDIGGIKLLIAGPLPRPVRTTEYGMRIPASKESTIRRKGKKVLSHTTRPTGCHDPRADQTSIGFDTSFVPGDRPATANHRDSQYSEQKTSNQGHGFPSVSENAEIILGACP